MSYSDGDIDYEDKTTGGDDDGDYQLNLTTIHPYLAASYGDADFWLSAGGGGGEVVIGDEEDRDADLATVTIGASYGVGAGLAGKIKAEYTASKLSVEADPGGDTEDEFTTQTLRLLLAADNPISSTALVNWEVGVRRHNNEAVTEDGENKTTDNDTAAEAKIGITARNNRLTTAADAHIINSKNYNRIGITGTLRLSPGNDGQGAEFRDATGIFR